VLFIKIFIIRFFSLENCKSKQKASFLVLQHFAESTIFIKEYYFQPPQPQIYEKYNKMNYFIVASVQY